MSFFKKKDAASLGAERYRGTAEELSYGELRAASWFVRHRENLFFIFRVALVAWCVVTIGFSGVYWLYYGAYGYWQDKKAINNHAATFINYAALQDAYAPSPLRVGDVRFLRYDNGKTDVIAEVENPNNSFVVTVRYTYNIDGKTLPESEMVVLPGSRAVLPQLGLTNSSQASLVLLESKWRRVSSHRVPDPIIFARERLSFDISDILVSPGTKEVPFIGVSFKVQNNTAFGYKEFSSFAVFRSGRAVVGILPLSFAPFRSGGSEDVDVRLPLGAGEPDSVELISRQNVFDETVFLPVAD